MSILIDTSVWSQFFRRKTPDHPQAVAMLKTLINQQRAILTGRVKQELLSGIKESARFNKLLSALADFEPLLATDEDHILAGRLFSQCRSARVQGSFSDFLICAQAINNRMPILTTDKDFAHYAKHIAINLIPILETK